jgi:hypothetical protein
MQISLAQKSGPSPVHACRGGDTTPGSRSSIHFPAIDIERYLHISLESASISQCCSWAPSLVQQLAPLTVAGLGLLHCRRACLLLCCAAATYVRLQHRRPHPAAISTLSPRLPAAARVLWQRAATARRADTCVDAAQPPSSCNHSASLASKDIGQRMMEAGRWNPNPAKVRLSDHLSPCCTRNTAMVGAPNSGYECRKIHLYIPHKVI